MADLLYEVGPGLTREGAGDDEERVGVGKSRADRECPGFGVRLNGGMKRAVHERLQRPRDVPEGQGPEGGRPVRIETGELTDGPVRSAGRVVIDDREGWPNSSPDPFLLLEQIAPQGEW